MEFKNIVEVKFPGLEKCHLDADQDCPMGQIYDFACALVSFSIQRMKEAEEARPPKQEEPKEEIKAGE